MTMYGVLRVVEQAGVIEAYQPVGVFEAKSAREAVAKNVELAGKYVAIPTRSLSAYVAKPVERPKFQVSGGGGGE